jgi:hypothetical protein
VGIELSPTPEVGGDLPPYEPDAALVIDAGAARELADWYAMGANALARFDAGDATVSPITLWPEHFDLALSAGEVNYGGSPGDAEHDEPYLYVGPFARPLPAGGAGFWNEGFGASLSAPAVPDVGAAIAFFRHGRDASA